ARERNDPAWPTRGIASLLSSADIAFANLESPFSAARRSGDKGMVFHAAPEMAAALTEAGLDVVSTANNHTRDAGSEGVEYTLELLSKHGILAVGTAATEQRAHEGVVIARKGLGIGFLAYTFDQSNGNHKDVDDRVAMMDVDRMRADVEALLQRTDVVIV